MKTTAKEFERFKKSFKYWQEKLGLHEYRIDFFHKQLKDNYAQIMTSEIGKTATVCLTTKLDSEDVKCWGGPEVTGKHEAIHLLVRRLTWLARSRHCSENDIDEEDEKIVRRLEDVLK